MTAPDLHPELLQAHDLLSHFLACVTAGRPTSATRNSATCTSPPAPCKRPHQHPTLPQQHRPREHLSSPINPGPATDRLRAPNSGLLGRGRERPPSCRGCVAGLAQGVVAVGDGVAGPVAGRVPAAGDELGVQRGQPRGQPPGVGGRLRHHTARLTAWVPAAPVKLVAVAPLVQLNAPSVWSRSAPATAVPSAAH